MNEQCTTDPAPVAAATGLLYSALQLARCLGVTPQAIRNRLANVRPDGEMLASGNLTTAWRLESLPASLRGELEQAARTAGYHLVDHFLRAEPAPAPRDPKPPVILARPSDERFRDLLTVLQAIRDPSAPSLADRAFVWSQAVELYQALGSGRKLKRDLLRFLNRHAPWLARNSNALRVAFERRLKDPALVTDHRPEENATRRVEISQADIDTLERHAVFNCGGRVAQAFRECRQGGKFSPELASRLLANPSRKSGVPHSIRRAVSARIKRLDAEHRSPREAALQGSYVDRDWSHVHAGDWYQSDDTTLPVYYYVEDGKAWFELMRGQSLLTIDVRSKRILDGLLVSRPGYDAFAIRSSMNRVCGKYGIPRKGFWFEQGIWKSSRMIKGFAQPALSLSDVVAGFQARGLMFRHARTAREKVIENVIGLLQNRMFGVPGYVGRNEMVEKYDRVQRAKEDVKAKRRHPRDAGFLSEDEWTAQLSAICDAYNADPQESKLIGTLSPDAAWERFQNPDDPPIQYDAACRRLWTTERCLVTVRRGRITLPIKKPRSMCSSDEEPRHLTYMSEAIARLEGQQLFAWLDPDCVEVITLTDRQCENAFCAPLAPAVDADGYETMAPGPAAVSAGNRYWRRRYLELRAGFVPKGRRNIVEPKIEALNRAMAGQQEAVLQQESARASRERRLTEAAREVGLNRGALNPNTDQALEASRDLARHLATLDREGDA